jgi:hypothetical protein
MQRQTGPPLPIIFSYIIYSHLYENIPGIPILYQYITSGTSTKNNAITNIQSSIQPISTTIRGLHVELSCGMLILTLELEILATTSLYLLHQICTL